MKLNIIKRLNLARLFPKEGGILQQLLIRDIAKKIEFTQDEIKEIELKQSGNQITWNPEKDIEKEINFSESEINFLKDQVTLLDNEKKVTQDMLDLCLLIKNN
jgi:hypothetical protein